MSIDFHEQLNVKARVMQFYYWLSRGFFSEEETSRLYQLNEDNFKTLAVMNDHLTGSDRPDFVLSLIFQTDEVIVKAKGYLKYTQIGSDTDIADYVRNNSTMFQYGIDLKHLRSLLNIETMFKNGYMLHDAFLGYPEKSMFSFRVYCVDYIYSAAHFYNEGYAYYHNQKQIDTYKCLNHSVNWISD